MSIGLTSSITSNTSYSSQFQMTKDDDILIIRGATVTLLAPQGEIYTNAGDDDVLIDGSTITANESNLKFYLGSGNDLLTLKNCTISVDISLYNGDDKVIVDGIPEHQVNLNNSLLFGNGNDVLELVSTLKNEGAIEFGTTGSKTLKFNGGTLLGNGTATGLTNIDVSLSGGFLGTNLSLSEEQTGITFNGSLFGITGEEEISIVGGNTVLAVETNAQTNIHFVLSGANVLQNTNATLAFLNYTGYAVSGENSEARLHNITTQVGGAFWGCNSNLILSNCDVSVSNEQTPFVVEEESTVTGEQLSFSSNQGKGAVLIDNSSVNVSEFNAYNNKKIDIVSASCTASAYAPVFAYRRNDTVLKTASNNCAAYSYAHGGSIYQSGGNTTLTNACFSGNSALASSYLEPIAIAKIAASATGYTTKDALCNTVIHYATAIAIASATARAFGNAEAFGGAIFQTGGTLSLNNASFANNEAYTQVTLAGSGSRIITTACYIGYASTYATAQVYHHADAQACGGAIYLCDGEANLTDVSFSGNKASSDYNEKTLGGAIFLTNSVLNYKINAGKTISNINNVAKKGGWLYADNNSIVAFNIESNSLLEIGDADKVADQTSYDDSIAGTTDSLITKNGLGTLCINSDISEYAGKWIINDGIIHLCRTFQTITFDDWSIGTNGTLILSDEQDIVDMGISKEIGTIDFGSGTDILNINEYDLIKGKILVETITINGSGRIGATISNRNITKGNDVTFNGIILDSDYWGNQYDDKLTINEETTFNGQMGLGGGNNTVHVKGTLVSTKGFKIERGGVTNVYAYYGSTIADNMLTVYADEEAARNTITLDWSEQSDLNKVRILISSDWTFDTFEFNIEFYNQNKSFTLNLQQDYFVQFQFQNEDGEWEHCLLPDSENPDQVTGVSFDGKWC